MKVCKLTALALAVLMLLSLTACGASSQKTESAVGYNYAADMAPQEPMAMEEMAYAETMASNSLSSESGTTAEVPAQRKWIITMDISAETEDLDALLEALNEEIAALGGYVEGQNIYNGSAYATRRYRSANLTVRIPADQADQFAGNVAGIANVVRSNKNLEDITLNYVSTESRVKALQVEEERLLELMEQAETMSDLLEIEGRLTDVRYELERYTSRLKVYDNQVDYATIYLNLEEVQEYTPVAERTVWQRITEGFAGNLKGLGEDLTDVFVWFVTSLPYLVVWAVGIAVAVVLVKKLGKKRPVKSFKRKPAESEKKNEE